MIRSTKSGEVENYVVLVLCSEKGIPSEKHCRQAKRLDSNHSKIVATILTV